MVNKFLKEIGYAPLYETLSDTDERWPQWKHQIENHGFADFELWNLDLAMVANLYERLVRFQEASTVDNGAKTVKWHGKDYTVEKIIKKICKRCRYVLLNAFSPSEEVAAKADRYYREIWEMWSKVRLWY